MMKKLRDAISRVFAARAAAGRFVYQHRSVVNRKMRRSADAQLRRKPAPTGERLKALHNILKAAKNTPAMRLIETIPFGAPLTEKQAHEYIPQPRKRKAA